jgi:uncharacterized membrane protein YfcA
MKVDMEKTFVTTNEALATDIVASGRKNVNRYFIGGLVLLALAVGFYFLYPYIHIDVIRQTLSKDHHLFYWMVLVGFLAELVAGSMGMGYGVICTTILLILNIPPPIISASIHSAEAFTSAAGTVSHYKLGNINKKLTKYLAIPAIFGAILGAVSLSYLGEHYAKITKPFIAAYTIYLGVRIIQNAFKKKAIPPIVTEKRKTNITVLGFIGGFIDSFGGGGWGPLVTGTFIKNGRTPRYVIGSSTAAKFVLTFVSAVTFIFTVGIHHWNIVAGLLIGGIVTAPFSAMLTAKLPVKKMFVAVGIVVIVMGLITIYRSLFL